MSKLLPAGVKTYTLTGDQKQGGRVLSAGTEVVLLATSPGAEYIAVLVDEWGMGKQVLISQHVVRAVEK